MGLNKKSDGSYAVGVGVPDESAWQNDVWNSGGVNLPNNCVLELPEPTEEDVGKTLTIEAKFVDDKTIVPEQVSTLDDEEFVYFLTDFDTTHYLAGASVKINIEGAIESVGTVEEVVIDLGGETYVEGYTVAYIGDSFEYTLIHYTTDEHNNEALRGKMLLTYDGLDEAPASITVSACTVHTEYEGKAVTPSGGGDGYDLEIVCNVEPSSATVSDFTIVDGEFEAVETKAVSGKPLKARLSFIFTSDGKAYGRYCELSAFDEGYRALTFYCGEVLTSTKHRCVVYYDSDYQLDSIDIQA